MYQNNPTRVLTGEVRLSYCNLVEPRANVNGGEPKYSVTLLIPKTDANTLNDIKQSMAAAYEEGVNKKWGGARPRGREIIHDGDGVRDNGTPFGEECRGCWVITASSKRRPSVRGIDNYTVELAPQDIYSGMYGRVSLTFFAYDTVGAKGVACGLDNVLKTREGDPLSGGASADSDFAEVAAAYQQAAPAAAPAQYQQAAPAPAVTYQAINPLTGLPM